jgi:glucosamine-6-phosphate deaminase
MEVIIQPTAQDVCKLAARRISKTIRQKPSSVLGLATGSTPIPLYKELVRMHREEKLDFSKVTTFNLDEYIGLGPSHPCSYHYFMHEHLFRHINVPKDQIHIPDGLAKDVLDYCKQYEEAIWAAGGIDLQVLGIGGNGHIGFNEVSSSLGSRTRIKTLTQKTIQDNQRFFKSGEAVPRHVITMGVGTILEARLCLLLAYGDNKSEAVTKMVEGPVTANLPASVLQLHPHALVIVDEAAGKNLEHSDYYRYVNDNKPAWQKIP